MNRVDHARTVIITGAAGFLGSALVEKFAHCGYDVIPLVRDPGTVPSVAGIETYRCDLPDEIDPGIPFNDSVVVHCAFTTRFRDEEDGRKSNISGTEKLIERSRSGGANMFVFISSMSSHARALSIYGRHKYLLEGRVKEAFDRHLLVRPGLIVGHGGLFARMADMIGKLHVYPEFRFGDKYLQYIAIEDVCTAILHAVVHGVTGEINLAHPEKVTPVEFYRRVARCMQTWAIPVMLPGNASLAVLRLVEKLKIPFPVSSDNLLGLKMLEYYDVTDSLERVDIKPRRLEEIRFDED